METKTLRALRQSRLFKAKLREAITEGINFGLLSPILFRYSAKHDSFTLRTGRHRLAASVQTCEETTAQQNPNSASNSASSISCHRTLTLFGEIETTSSILFLGFCAMPLSMVAVIVSEYLKIDSSYVGLGVLVTACLVAIFAIPIDLSIGIMETAYILIFSFLAMAMLNADKHRVAP